MSTKTFKTIGIVIVCICIAIVGYLMYQEATASSQPVIAQPEPQVTAVNDSTYHINLSDKCCITLEKNCDTLNIYKNGATMVCANKANDTIEIIEGLRPNEYLYTITYHDFYKDTFAHISFK